MIEIPPFFRPYPLTSSSDRKAQIQQRYHFYKSAAAHSFLVVFAGIVFIGAFYAQLLSIVITGDSGGTPLSSFTRFALAIILSVIAIWLVTGIQKFEDISYYIGSDTPSLDNPDWPGNIWAVLIAIFIAGMFFWAALEVSKTVADESLYVSFIDLINKGEVLTFVARLLAYLTLAGALGLVVSAAALGRYAAYPYSKGIRAWWRRVRFYLNTKLAGEDFEEAMVDRCMQCCSDTFKIKTNDGDLTLYCSFCGNEQGEAIDSCGE